MTINLSRRDDLVQFYAGLAVLRQRCGGTRRLAECTGRMNWPQRGVYFFFESGEERFESGDGQRVVRVGTHALKSGSRTTLWKRLAQHRGVARNGGGGHRGSIFRLLVGTALAAESGLDYPSWGRGSSAPRETREREQSLERLVSQRISAMPFLWLAVADEPGPDSLRGYIERNAIALLSNYDRTALDPPSSTWLGHYCNRERVRRSGLWNQNHVSETHDPGFLTALEKQITRSAHQ